MVPITEDSSGNLHIAPTGQKPSGAAAWLGENFSMGVMLAAAATAAATLAMPFLGMTVAAGASGIGGLLGIGHVGMVSIGAVAAGGLIGALMDKRQAEKNAEEGVTVEKPTFMNRGILTEGLLKGGLNGMALAVAGMSLIGLAVPALSVGGLAAISPLVPVAIAGAAALFGAVRGSISRKEKMENVYKQVETAYFIQTGQVDRARGLLQEMGAVGPVVAAGVGVGAGLAAAGKAKAAIIDPGTVQTIVGAATGLHDDPPTQAEQYIAQTTKTHNPYDFSQMEGHPAAQAQRSFLEAEMERRAALEQGLQGRAIH